MRRAAGGALRRLAGAARRRVSPRHPHWGNLRRRDPFCAHWGYTRGTPVDRVYIESFLELHRSDIRGDVAEMMSGDYSRRFGAPDVRVHVVDVDPRNAAATVRADLCARDALPPGSFDAWVLTQTLQFVPDPEAALANVRRSLRPGGVALITVPCASPLAATGAPSGDLWRLTPAGLGALCRRAMPGARVDVRGWGTLTAMTAFLLGLAAEDLRPGDLGPSDPRYPLIASAVVRTPPAD